MKKIVAIYLFIFLFFPVFAAFATTAEELQNKINERNTTIAKLEEEIKAYTQNLNQTSEQKKTLQSAIQTLETTRKKLDKEISLTQEKIGTENIKIDIYSGDIKDKESMISQHKDAMQKSMIILNEKGTGNFLNIILSNDSISSAWEDISNISDIQDSFSKSVALLKKDKIELEASKTEREKVKENLQGLTADLGSQKKSILLVKNEKDVLLKETKNKESEYQKIIKDKTAARSAFEKELQALESELQFTLNPKSLPSNGSLAWPLDSIYITQQFGSGSGVNTRLYKTGSHNGTDFKALYGTKIMSMGDGVVMGTGDTDATCRGASFGKFVFIKYNNGLSSTYGHLSQITATEGQVVRAGDIVGYSGNTGYTTGPHLHVSVYASEGVQMKSLPSKSCGGRIYRMPMAATDAYLDPMKYIRK